ncbi:unnamed protein product [Miscanthus lutarioriparius]|uniref:Ubiquitin-like protein ATG12 n=1 Tax=Miscanthus lutarioriparius TaxID=422564 RepID=A0A811PDF0_9POAL|nr:unnamed protein product [Miscanthus lutarioriparius]
MAAEADQKVVVHVRSTGDAPILKQSKFKISGRDKFLKVIEFLRRQLHQDTLFVYINSAFSPNPDELVIDLYNSLPGRREETRQSGKEKQRAEKAHVHAMRQRELEEPSVTGGGAGAAEGHRGALPQEHERKPDDPRGGEQRLVGRDEGDRAPALVEPPHARLHHHVARSPRAPRGGGGVAGLRFPEISRPRSLRHWVRLRHHGHRLHKQHPVLAHQVYGAAAAFGRPNDGDYGGEMGFLDVVEPKATAAPRWASGSARWSLAWRRAAARSALAPASKKKRVAAARSALAPASRRRRPRRPRRRESVTKDRERWMRP